MFKDLLSLIKKKKRDEPELNQELSPEEKIRSQYVIRKMTYADGHFVFWLESSLDQTFTFKTLEEARTFLDNKVKARLANYLVNDEVVE
ncbi:hypothetical protein [uncultured Lactococcus sp.]|uniref:hypothetical protein n=1 Tax=uncultured Lactococcus sp. TaxID=167973 RepID=UPI00206F3FAA|nr:hypothetical protein [uncultured Lactococcus sp.]DAK67072.1 MAG TPA: hypothetical protein [Caudoviricetes sp.]